MPPAPRIDQVVVQMYRMGTGDCFVIKFLKQDTVSFKILIDCGCWSGSKEKLTPFVKKLKEEVGNRVDVLVVTHEHKDHVFGFEQCRDLFMDGSFQADQVWMAWTEADNPRVRKWKKDYGQKKFALRAIAEKLGRTVESQSFKDQLSGTYGAFALVERKKNFAKVLRDFADLHAREADLDALAAGTYVGDLEGMRVVKKEIANSNVTYFSPGDIKESVHGLEGVRIYVLGPPTVYDQVKTEKGPVGEAYEHNDDLADADAFAAAAAAGDEPGNEIPPPFDAAYISTRPKDQATYRRPDEAWRRIDHDWLFSAGSFALRMNSLTNNLSLVLAFEFLDSGKVLLFPGDAEFGSWKSWHSINWSSRVAGLTTEKLLNRTVFYKVAHHLSHNGTARGIGLDMMTSSDLCAMATLDYDVISNGWKSTMPNVGILRDLFEKTKGRTVIMNTRELLFDREAAVSVERKLEEYRRRMNAAERDEFERCLDESNLPLFVSLTIKL
jgi:hypothetical protein